MSWLEKVKFNEDGLIPAIAQDQQTQRVLMVAWMNATSLRLTAETNTAVYFSRSRQQLWYKGETSGHVQQVHSIRLDCDADVILLSVTQLGNIACHTGRESCFYQQLDLTTGANGELTWHTVDPVLKDPTEIYGKHDGHDNSGSQELEPVSEVTQDKQQIETSDILSSLDRILRDRKSAEADTSYVANLYAKGLNKILEKVGEESVETIIAGKDYQKVLIDSSSEQSDSSQITTEHVKKAEYELIYEIADLWFHTLVTLAWFNMRSDVILAELARRFGLSGIEEKNSR